MAILVFSCGGRKVALKEEPDIVSSPEHQFRYDEESVKIFLSMLEQEYRKRSDEFKKDGYIPDAQDFLRKSKLAKARDASHYNENTFLLTQKQKDEAQLAGLFLDKLRGNTVIFDLFPESLARMQVYYDCMLVEFRDTGYERKPRTFCTQQFDKMQKAFQRTGFTKNIKYDDESRETFVIYFDLGSDVISNQYTNTLRNIAKKAQSLPDYKIRIVGLADKTGSRERNRLISRGRSENTKNALVRFGVPASKISMEYLADDFSLVDTPNAERFNRRVVIDLIN
jgi:outer membrane protein OmpA-like peptidoglycan-associated protein